MTPRPRRTEQSSNLQERILNTAWKQIAAEGAAALSLRAIARELSITAPAIYNYYADRDVLVTALIVDAFISLADSQKAAIQPLASDGAAAGLAALGLAYRQWAITYPQRYQLIFGTPLPGYQAPADITLPAAVWALRPLIETMQSIAASGRLRTEQTAPLTPALSSMLTAWSQFADGVDVEVLYSALVIWSRVHGLVSMEIGGQMPSFITDPGEVFRREIENIKIQYLVG